MSVCVVGGCTVLQWTPMDAWVSDLTESSFGLTTFTHWQLMSHDGVSDDRLLALAGVVCMVIGFMPGFIHADFNVSMTLRVTDMR